MPLIPITTRPPSVTLPPSALRFLAAQIHAWLPPSESQPPPGTTLWDPPRPCPQPWDCHLRPPYHREVQQDKCSLKIRGKMTCKQKWRTHRGNQIPSGSIGNKWEWTTHTQWFRSSFSTVVLNNEKWKHTSLLWKYLSARSSTLVPIHRKSSANQKNGRGASFLYTFLENKTPRTNVMRIVLYTSICEYGEMKSLNEAGSHFVEFLREMCDLGTFQENSYDSKKTVAVFFFLGFIWEEECAFPQRKVWTCSKHTSPLNFFFLHIHF